MVFEESRIRFEFDDARWQHLIKYDECTDYRNINSATEGTKAVDFVGIVDNHSLCLIEVKNFRSARIGNKVRIEEDADPLDLECAHKVRDTLAGIIGGARNSTNDGIRWKEYMRYLTNAGKEVRVILWLEEDTAVSSPVLRKKRSKARRASLNQRLKRRMKWLTTKCLVANIANNPYPNSLSASFI